MAVSVDYAKEKKKKVIEDFYFLLCWATETSVGLVYPAAARLRYGRGYLFGNLLRIPVATGLERAVIRYAAGMMLSTFG